MDSCIAESEVDCDSCMAIIGRDAVAAMTTYETEIMDLKLTVKEREEVIDRLRKRLQEREEEINRLKDGDSNEAMHERAGYC